MTSSKPQAGSGQMQAPFPSPVLGMDIPSTRNYFKDATLGAQCAVETIGAGHVPGLSEGLHIHS